MAFSTLDQIRAKLNAQLGVADGSTAPFGSSSDRNVALQDAFARLWPTMARLHRETVPVLANTVDYTLSTVRDLLTIEELDAESIVRREIRNFRTWVDESADPPVRRLLLPVGYTAATVTWRAVGYAPYKVPVNGADTADIEPRLEWIVVAGAISFLYQRRFHEFTYFEQRQHQNVDNVISPAELFSMYQDAERRFLEGISGNRRSLALPKVNRLRRPNR